MFININCQPIIYHISLNNMVILYLIPFIHNNTLYLELFGLIKYESKMEY